MSKKLLFLFLGLLFTSFSAVAQDGKVSELQERADEEYNRGYLINSRALYLRAFEDYIKKGQLKQGVECGIKVTSLYTRENSFKESFEMLRRLDQAINSGKNSATLAAELHYQVAKERLQIYMKIRKGESAKVQLNNMENYARQAKNDSLANDYLYNKTIYYYSFGKVSEGNEAFGEMANKLTSVKEYDKVDAAYKALVNCGRQSGNANLVYQSFSSYNVWKDSVEALKVADSINALKQQIADNEATIAEKDSSLSTRQGIIIGLTVLVVALAAALLLGAVILMRFVFITRKQRKTIKLANETNALKAKFISNISSQLVPTLNKLDDTLPEVQAMLDFSRHIQDLSDLENTPKEDIVYEEVQITPFCEEMMEQIRDYVKPGVELTVNAPKMTAMLNRDYVSHILTHLLFNAAEYASEGGHIRLEFKKRGAHTHQFIVSDTGTVIPEEMRDDVFKPFLEIRDLTQGDGLGLPICKQMALKMDGDLTIDPEFTKGTRFILDLHA